LLGIGRTMSLPVFMSSHSSKDGGGFMETARLIAGENPPRWLAKHLQRWSSSVMLDGNVHAKQLGKAEAQARLQKLSKAADLVQREVHDPAIFELLVASEFGPMPNNAGIDTVLEEIRRRADVASSRLNLLATGVDERLGNLSDGAKLVAREIRDSALSEFLEAEELIGPQPSTTELSALLKEIVRKADTARLSPDLSNKAGDTKAGAGRAFRTDASRPRTHCAAVVLEAWAHFHGGEYPRGSNHPRLWKAAVEYWRACGGTKRWGYGEPLLWRPYFEEAARSSMEETRIELRRHMRFSSLDND
jgi:hypothetical protein